MFVLLVVANVTGVHESGFVIGFLKLKGNKKIDNLHDCFICQYRDNNCIYIVQCQ